MAMECDEDAGASRHRLRDALAARAEGAAEFRVEIGLLEAGWRTAADFFADDDAIGDLLRDQAAQRAGSDAKTGAALLMLDYCYIFMLASVPLLVRAGIVPDLAPSRMALQFLDSATDHDHAHRCAHVRYLSATYASAELCGQPDAVAVADVPALCAHFRDGVEQHFAPLVETLWRKTGLARRALWRLVADAIAGRCLEVGREAGQIEAAKAIGMAIVKQPGSPLLNRQLHYVDLTLHDDAGKPVGSWTFRSRGGCCRFYTMPGGALCSTCVLKDPAERDAELLAMMRAHVHRLLHGEG